jgi:hypothetical protein
MLAAGDNVGEQMREMARRVGFAITKPQTQSITNDAGYQVLLASIGFRNDAVLLNAAMTVLAG